MVRNPRSDPSRCSVPGVAATRTRTAFRTAAGLLVLFGSLLPASSNGGERAAPEPSRERAGQEAEPQLPTLHSLQQQIRAAVHREATARTLLEREGAIRGMADLYRRIQDDPRYPTHEVLRRGRARLWGRLTMIQRDLERTNKRLERELKLPPTGRARSAPGDPAVAVTGVLIAHYDLVGSTLGGPGKIFASGGTSAAPTEPRGGAAQLDHGEMLVELIQRTIMPKSWDVNGGPGTIVYYAPLHALVISATEEVHEKIGGVLGGVRE